VSAHRGPGRVAYSTTSGNIASEAEGLAGGIANASSSTFALRGTILADNNASGGNCYGKITDAGYNVDDLSSIWVVVKIRRARKHDGE
jgi:hypothetical protein